MLHFQSVRATRLLIYLCTYLPHYILQLGKLHSQRARRPRQNRWQRRQRATTYQAAPNREWPESDQKRESKRRSTCHCLASSPPLAREMPPDIPSPPTGSPASARAEICVHVRCFSFVPPQRKENRSTQRRHYWSIFQLDALPDLLQFTWSGVFWLPAPLYVAYLHRTLPLTLCLLQKTVYLFYDQGTTPLQKPSFSENLSNSPERNLLKNSVFSLLAVESGTLAINLAY